jgi:hypothetical protein
MKLTGTSLVPLATEVAVKVVAEEMEVMMGTPKVDGKVKVKG